MAEIKFKIEGLNELLATVESLPKNIANKALRKGLEAGATVMGKEVQARVPVGPASKRNEAYGHLRDSVGIAVTIPRDGFHGFGNVGFGDKDYLAKWVEFGHRQIGHKPGKKDLGFVGAHPMLRPAFDASSEPAFDAFVAEVKKAVDEVKK